MPKSNHIHIVPRSGGWAVQREGGERASHLAPTQREATNIGRDMSRRESGELYIHRPNGQIRDRDSHGNDPRGSKG